MTMMLASMFLLLFHSLCMVSSIPFNCPSQCTCIGERTTICKVESLKELDGISEMRNIEKVMVASCSEEDYNEITQQTASKIVCQKLKANDGNEREMCEYRSTNFPNDECVYMCTGAGLNLKSSCLCFNCGKNTHRGVLRVRRSTLENTNDTGNSTQRSWPVEFETHFIMILGATSFLAFLVNFVVMIKLCCSSLTVIGLFGTALTLFNVMLSTYGVTMTFYLWRPTLLDNPVICRFFVSIKLFSLGSGLYTMTFLIFHRPINDSSDDNHDRVEVEEGKKKAVKKDAIFKGIVFLLEAVMLAGVLGVLSWIPLPDNTHWKPLCVIITPENSVEGLLHGIECWYYVLSGLLVVFYIGNYINSKVTKLRQYRENLKKIKDGDEDEGLLGADEKPESPPYIIKDFPLFVLVTCSFCVWIGGFVITLPRYDIFKTNGGPEVVRLCSLMIPLILQPIIYVIRNTCLFQCPCLVDPRHRADSVDEKIEMEKRASDDTSQSNNNLHVVATRFESLPPAAPPIATKEEDLTDKNENEKLDDKKTKMKVNDFEVPKVVCRSPNLSGERTALLDDMDGKKASPETPTIVVVDDLGEEPPESNLAPTAEPEGSMELLNGADETDANGRVSRGPTFYPIAEKENDGLNKQSDNKPPTPIEEEVEVVFPNSQKTKKGSKRGSKKSNSVSSSGSGDSYSRSDSSTSHDSTALAEPNNDLNSISSSPADEVVEPCATPSELTRLKNQINKPTLNINNNISYDDVITGENESLLNSSEDVMNNDHDVIAKVNSKGSEGNADTNHTSARLKKPLLTRDNSGSVER